MSRYVGAIDQGTTSTRFMVFDREGTVITVAQEEHAQIYPAPGHVEHDAAEIWAKTQKVMKEALTKGNLTPKDLAAIGITNQRETTVIWDRKTPAPAQRPRLAGHSQRPASSRNSPTRAGATASATSLACRWRATSPASSCAGSSTTCRVRRRGRGRRRPVRQYRHLAPVEPHRRS